MDNVGYDDQYMVNAVLLYVHYAIMLVYDKITIKHAKK